MTSKCEQPAGPDLLVDLQPRKPPFVSPNHGATRLLVRDRLLEIDNYTHDETRESLIDYYPNLSSHLFILLPGEYVRKVEVSYTDESVTAIKLHKSRRVTPWYGACHGRREVFEADDGLCINALRGKCGPDGCSELGVVFAPQEIAKGGHSAVVSEGLVQRLVIGNGSPAWLNKYLTWAEVPRAIVVTTTETSVEKVRIVTDKEYDRIVQFPESFEHTAQEQWFVLVEGERLEAIGVDIEDNRVKAVRFLTNLQTTQAYGVANKARVVWLPEDDDDPDPFICGIEFEATQAHGESPMTAISTISRLPTLEPPLITMESAANTMLTPTALTNTNDNFGV